MIKNYELNKRLKLSKFYIIYQFVLFDNLEKVKQRFFRKVNMQYSEKKQMKGT